MFHQPLDAVPGIGRLVGRLRIVGMDGGGEGEGAAGFEAAAHRLVDEHVAVLRERPEALWQARRGGGGSAGAGRAPGGVGGGGRGGGGGASGGGGRAASRLQVGGAGTGGGGRRTGGTSGPAGPAARLRRCAAGPRRAGSIALGR